MKNKSTQELIQIVSFGGGLDMDASDRSTHDLIQIASFSQEGSRIVLRGMGNRRTADMVQIASFGKKNVVFAD